MAKKEKLRKRGRKERQFFPRSTTNPWLVRLAGAIGAMLLGAGVYGQFLIPPPASDVATASEDAGKSGSNPLKGVPWILAGGAGLFAIAIWIGTPGGAVLRVGDGGVGVERGPVRRIPWHRVEAVRFLPAKQVLRVTGQDEAGTDFTVDASVKAQAPAAARILEEAKERVPEVVDVAEDEAKSLPEPHDDDSLVLDMTPLQVVGMRCAASDKIISYEPDARVCPRCERAYHKAHVPPACACGADLAALRSEGGTASHADRAKKKKA